MSQLSTSARVAALWKVSVWGKWLYHRCHFNPICCWSAKLLGFITLLEEYSSVVLWLFFITFENKEMNPSCSWYHNLNNYNHHQRETYQSNLERHRQWVPQESEACSDCEWEESQGAVRVAVPVFLVSSLHCHLRKYFVGAHSNDYNMAYWVGKAQMFTPSHGRVVYGDNHDSMIYWQAPETIIKYQFACWFHSPRN